jgi:hypothetical protein
MLYRNILSSVMKVYFLVLIRDETSSIPNRGGVLSSPHFQSVSEDHLPACPMCTDGPFPGAKRPGLKLISRLR